MNPTKNIEAHIFVGLKRLAGALKRPPGLKGVINNCGAHWGSKGVINNCALIDVQNTSMFLVKPVLKKHFFHAGGNNNVL